MLELPPSVDLFKALQHETLVQYFAVAGAALFGYDVLIHVDVELKYIWTPLDPRQPPIQRAFVLMFNLLYIAQRYMPFLDQVILIAYFGLGASTPRACTISFAMISWGCWLGIGLSEIMLSLRIWAVWARKPLIGGILVLFGFGCMASAGVFLARFLGGVQYPDPEFDIHVPEVLKRCFSLMKNKDIFVCWVWVMVYDSFSLILMAIPGFTAYRIGGSSNLVKVVYRDGVIYYALVFMVSSINVIIILNLSTDLVIIITPFERVLHSIFASHAILHIRSVALQDHIQTCDTWDGMATTTDFTLGSVGVGGC